MTVQTAATLKTYFEAGDKPTQSNYEDLIDTVYGKGVVYAAAYGVSASASAADNLTALQAALDYASNNGYPIVVLPTGTFNIGGAIQIKDAGGLVGMPGFGTVLNFSGTDPGADGAVQVWGGTFRSGTSNALIQDLDIVVPNTWAANGIEVRGARNIVRRCRITKAANTGYGIHLYNKGVANGWSYPGYTAAVGTGLCAIEHCIVVGFEDYIRVAGEVASKTYAVGEVATTLGSSDVVFTDNGHGITTGTSIVFDSVTVNGVTFNGTLFPASVAANSYTITGTGTASSTGTNAAQVSSSIILSGANACQIIGGQGSTSGVNGVNVIAADNISIHGFTVDDATGYGVRADLTAAATLVTGCFMEQLSTGAFYVGPTAKAFRTLGNRLTGVTLYYTDNSLTDDCCFNDAGNFGNALVVGNQAVQAGLAGSFTLGTSDRTLSLYGGNSVSTGAYAQFLGSSAVSGTANHFRIGFASNDYFRGFTSGGNVFTDILARGASGKARLLGVGGATVTVDNAGFVDISGSGSGWRVDSTGNLRPLTDNLVSLGTGAFRPTEIYAVAGAINTSDKREKTHLRSADADERLMNVSFSLTPSVFTWKQGQDGKKQIGIYAQHLEAAMIASGLDPAEWGMLDLPREDNGNRYGVRYDQVLMLLVAALTKRVQALEGLVKDKLGD